MERLQYKIPWNYKEKPARKALSTNSTFTNVLILRDEALRFIFSVIP